MKINFNTFFYSAIGALCILGYAFYNGYPIVYSDTSTYIVSGFELIPPPDRPILYGLLIRLISLNGLSLWPVAFTQSLILSFLIYLTIRDFNHLTRSKIFFIITIILLSSFTVLPFVSGQIMTDIFISIAVLCIIHLACNPKLHRSNSILLFVIFFLANAMHLSHLMINILFMVFILLLKRYFFRKSVSINYRNILILFVLTISGIIAMEPALAKSRNVFFMGRMAENGILIDFLKETCPEKKYKLCDCIDSIPTNTNDFLWDKASPVYTKYIRWSGTREEFGKIIFSTFIRPEYLIRHISESMKSTIKQLQRFDAGDGNGPFMENTLLYERINKYFHREALNYSLSRQSRGLLNVDKLRPINRKYRITVVFTLTLILLLFLTRSIRNQIPAYKKFVAILLLTAIFLNSFVNSSLVMVTDRFGAKMIWLIPFVLIFLLLNIDFTLLFRKDHPLK
jgi:hypothetical protein